MISTTFPVKGMHCASCAATIEKTLKKTAGITTAEVNFATETVSVLFDETKIDPKKLSKTIEPLGYSLVIPSTEAMNMSADEHTTHLGLRQTKEEQQKELITLRTTVLSIFPLAIISIGIMAWELLAETAFTTPIPYVWKEFFHHLVPLFATYTLFVAGKPYLLGLYRFLRYGSATMDTLIGLGTSVAYIYSFIVTAFEDTLKPYLNVEHTYYDVTIVVITFIILGKYLETRSKRATGDAIEKLLNLQAKTALVRRDGREQEIALNDVHHNDLIIIKPGAKIPVDGIVVEGSSFVDEALVTGEPMPVEKNIGTLVVAGTINTSGSFVFRATKVGAETMLSNIIAMVEKAQGSRAPIQALADTISSIFVPVVLGISLLTLGIWLAVGSHYLGFSQALTYGLSSFVGVLVIACPCALGLATPTAIIVGVGRGAHEGILIKDAATLEKLYRVDTIILDKTGTLTTGKPGLTAIKNFSQKKDTELIALLAALEQYSEHPVASAIKNYVQKKAITAETATDFESIKGKGVRAVIGTTTYCAGTTQLLTDLGIVPPLVTEAPIGATEIFLATTKEVLGKFFVTDRLKPETPRAIKALQNMNINVIMMTGDTENAAREIARQAGIENVMAKVLPEHKLEKIKTLQAEGHIVAMVGDGVNDAPALAGADVGIAMATGTDVAIETAGITLLQGDISKLVKAIHLSKLTMRGIKQNLFWAFIYNIIGIPLAAGLLYPVFGQLISPIFAGLAMALSSVSVVSNSLRLKVKKL